MPALIYPDLSWSGRFHRFLRMLRIVGITGTIGAVAGGAGVLAMMRLIPETPQPLHAAVRKPVIIHAQAVAEATPAPAVVAVAALPAAAAPPAAAPVKNADTFGAPPAGALPTGSFYDRTNLPDTALAAEPAAPAKEHAPPARAKRPIAHPRKPVDVAARAGRPLALAPGRGQGFADNERSVWQHGYYDQWRGPPARHWDGGD